MPFYASSGYAQQSIVFFSLYPIVPMSHGKMDLYAWRASPLHTCRERHQRTNLASVRDVIAKRRNSLLGHVVRLDDHTPAHRALSQVAAARTGHRFGRGWQRQPGCPRHSWIQQISDGTPFSIRAEWSKSRCHGHLGLMQRTSAVYAI